MSKQRYPEEFKTEAVKQITERGHKVADVSARLGVSQHSLYQWIKSHQVPAAERQVQGSQTDELRRLKAELKRVTEERDILKNGHRTRRTAPLKRNTCRPKISRASGSGRQL
ncbi:transposase, partial [Comamonas sp. JUb58]|uniref:transposase n=1 Tax=Comamonas sp. JUb58 TaxID=2485114 RepID=UPI0010DF854D